MKKTLIFTVSLFLFAWFFGFSAQAESIVPDGVEHANSFTVIMQINSDATIAVEETIDYNYGTKTKPGITRYIPIAYQNLKDTNISVGITGVSVADENGNQYVFRQSRVQGDNKKAYLKIDIGDEKQPVSGNKKYIVRYTVSNAIQFLNDRDELFWNVTGDRWPVYVKYPKIKIKLPQEISRNQISKKCYIGLQAATVECIDRINNNKNGNINYTYKGVVSGEDMTVVYGFPKGIVQKKSEGQGNFWSILKTDRNLQKIFFLSGIFLTIIIVLAVSYLKTIARSGLFKKYKEKLNRARQIIKHVLTQKLKDKKFRRQAIISIVLGIILISGVNFIWKVRNTLNKISTNRESVSSVVRAGFSGQSKIKGENDGQINLLLLGILGANHPGGGLNADTILVVSIRPNDNKISLISIPRDLWVTDPGKETKSKINAVYVYGEEKSQGQGIKDMESVVSEITGLSINYSAVISTQGFVKLVDILGGVEVNLSKPFNENTQYIDIKVCDSDTYTIATGEFQEKKKNGKIVTRYPLCKNRNPECGGNFRLPAGRNILSGEQALCFSRSRYLTNDFERAKRQQLLLKQLKEKVTQIGINDFSKINPILDNLGDSVRTDMQLWEMRRFFDLYKGMDNPKMYQRVLEDSKDGLLYSPDETPETGFILLPRGDNYDKIKELFQEIFNSKN